jgi:HK97 family phage prohead protease
MPSLITRTHTADLEVRSSGDGRTVHGIAVPFDAPTEIADAYGHYVEMFRRGSFTKTIAERGSRVKFLTLHDRGRLPVGRAVLLREDAAGLYAELRVSQTQAGDELLALIGDGAVDALSVGFIPVQDRWSKDKTQVERVEVALREISAVTEPAYAAALIGGVRSNTLTISADAAARRLRLLEMTL